MTSSSIRLIGSAQELFSRMLAAIAAARRYIHLEVYALAPTGIGEKFIAALRAARVRGVQVRVVIDGWGSRPFAGSVVRALREGGCDAAIYNPLRLGFLGRLRRNHRKLLIIDDEVAFLGGFNLTDAFIGPSGWADVAVEIRGLACEALGRRLRHEHGPLDPRVRALLSSTGGGRRLRRRYLKAFGRARTRILLAHSYFMPDAGLLRSLTAAARRGVDVTLLVPGRSDVPIARLATQALYRRLVAAGIRVLEWDASVLHSKLAVIDGERLLIGSFNLDPFSLVDLEALVDAEDSDAARAAEAWIERRAARARRITPRDTPTSFELRLRDYVGQLAQSGAEVIGRLLRRA